MELGMELGLDWTFLVELAKPSLTFKPFWASNLTEPLKKPSGFGTIKARHMMGTSNFHVGQNMC